MSEEALYLVSITAAFFIYLLVSAIVKLFKRNDGYKIKDEPIEGLYCKFCGKAQSQCGKFDTDCPHQWQEEMK